MYAKNVLNLLGDMIKDGQLVFDFEDEVLVGSLVTYKGDVVHERVREAHGLGPKTQPQEA